MEDTRLKHKPFQSATHHIGLDCINPQVLHSSPYHVHPYPSPVRLQHAFQPVLHSSTGVSNVYQNKGLPKQNNEFSGLRNYITPTESPILGRALCLTPKSSPIPGRVSQLSDRIHDSLTMVADTDALVAKISAMFPTVSETHIKILLKKYYNREAVVISALQVEKHPITTPGPLAMSPSVSRLQKGALGIYSALQLAKGVSGSTQMTPLTISPHGSPSLRPASVGSGYYSSPRSIDTSLPRPHPSPKMKLRYLKSVFPKAEETLILDVLANKDNNVQKASEELLSMGFTKRETINKSSNKSQEKKEPPPPAQVQHVKTAEEKATLKVKLTKKYTTIAERVVSIALESVDWNEDRAEQILSVVVQEEAKPKVNKKSNDNESELKTKKSQENTDANSIHLNKSTPVSVAAYAITGKQDEQTNIGVTDELKDKTTDSIINQHKFKGSRRHKIKGDNTKTLVTMSHGAENNFISPFMIKAKGPNPELQNGPKDNLLLADYITWNGPNPEYRTRCLIKPEGPEVHIPKRRSSACGPNASLHSGPARLAKGSIYQNINKTSLF